MQHSDILKQLVTALGPMSNEAFSALCGIWHPVSVPRRTIITRQGDVEKYLYLMVEGAQRAYCLHHDREATLVFSYAPSFSGIIDSYFLQQPSAYNLETLTRSSFLRVHYNDFSTLMETYTEVDRWVRIAVTRVLADTLKRQTELLTFTAAEKFSALVQRSPHILQVVPHKYLASYIGVDATNFSKMLGRIRI